MTEELDGPSLSDDARDAFYAAEGRWEATVRDLGPRRVEALRALRTLRDEKPNDLLRLIREGRPLLEGALVEVEAAVKVLEKAGAVALAVRQAGS